MDSLKHKYADELTVYRSRPHALELCDRMADAVTPGQPKNKLTCDHWAHGLFQKLRDRGIRVESWWRLTNYLEECLHKLLLPQVNDVLRSLFPKAREKGLIPRSRIEVPFLRRREWKHGMGYFVAALDDQAAALRARGVRSEPAPATV